MEKAKIYTGINLVTIIDSVMLATAQEFYGLIEGTLKNAKKQHDQFQLTSDLSETEKCIVKIVLLSSNKSYLFIVDNENPLTILDQDIRTTFVEGVPSEWDRKHIEFCFKIKNIIRTMMIDSSGMKDIDNTCEGRHFVAILVLDVVANISRLIVLECEDYNKLEIFYNDLNLSLLNLEESFDFPLIGTAAPSENHELATSISLPSQTDEMIPFEKLKSLKYIVIFEIFENVDGYYQQVERDRSLFKFNRQSHHRVRITFINTNEHSHNFVFDECEKFTVILPNGNVIYMTNIFFVHARDTKRSFYLTANWEVNDDDLYTLVENSENKKIHLALDLYLMSKLLNSLFCYQLELDLTYKTVLDRLIPLSRQPISFRITLCLKECEQNALVNNNEDNNNNPPSEDGDKQRFNSSNQSLLSTPTTKLVVLDQTFINMINPILKNKIANRLLILFDIPHKGFIGNFFDIRCDSDDDSNYTGNFESSHVKIPSVIKTEWNSIFKQWVKTKVIPPNAMNLIKTYGVFPEIRKKFWLMQSGAYERLDELTLVYNDLLTKNSEYEKIIGWDVRRTFPTHPQFKNSSDPGQTTLYNICKAYSLFDPEVGYCQGMSFIIATILLVADEMETFAITVQIMQKYSQRDIYMENFQLLQLEFFIFERLLHKSCPELYNHLKNCGIEYHMFLTQWILTMFSAKFPLSMTFAVVDFFLLEGRHALIKLSIALLMISKHDILKINFDEILRYFRLNLPRFYISKVNCQNLINFAKSLDINNEEVDLLILDYNRQKSEATKPNDPVESLKAEKNVLFNRLIRMEIENDILARELIKYQLKNEKQVASLEQIIDDKDAEIQFMMNEIDSSHVLIQKYSSEENNIKETLRKCVNETDLQLAKNTKIIEHYKSICSSMENRSIKMESENKTLWDELKRHETECENCHKVAVLLTNNTDCANTISSSPTTNTINSPTSEINPSDQYAKQLEHELIVTKDHLAEASNTINDLLHEISELKIDSKTPWFKKLTSNLKNKNNY